MNSFTPEQTALLRDVFGQPNLRVEDEFLQVGGTRYPVVDGVIVLLRPDQYPASVKARFPGGASEPADKNFARDIQFTFGEEWKTYSEVLPEHREEFVRYFDLVNVEDLKSKRVCDLGCGIGRWAAQLAPHCREILLVDFSDAIFVAKKNMAAPKNALFFMGDLRHLPFKKNYVDFIYSLGVLHHLEEPCLQVVRGLKDQAPKLLIFLYYALDNRPAHYRWLLKGVTAVRLTVSHIRAPWFRRIFSWLVALFLYKPLVLLGHLFALVGRGSAVPLVGSPGTELEFAL